MARHIAKNIVAAGLAKKCEFRWLTPSCGSACSVMIDNVEDFCDSTRRDRQARGQHFDLSRRLLLSTSISETRFQTDGLLWALWPKRTRIHVGEDASQPKAEKSSKTLEAGAEGFQGRVEKAFCLQKDFPAP